jgi:hypothetical protein
MDGRICTTAVVAVVLTAGGCFHSDAHRSGITDEGKVWAERVADEVTPQYIDELRGEILALGNPGEVDPREAALLADTAVRHGMVLARQYRMVRPIEIHNTLVHLGLRPRGLCYQTAEDMYVRLRQLDLKTLQLHWGVAHKGDLWLEHSSVIVTARGRPFVSGLVLDAWRHSGRLRWAPVAEDRYPWVRMFKRKFPELREAAVGETQLAGAGEGPVYRIESRAGVERPPDDAGAAGLAPARSDAAGGAAVARPPATTTPGSSPAGRSRTGQLSAIDTTRTKPE